MSRYGAPEGAQKGMYLFLFLLTLGNAVAFQGWSLLYTNFVVNEAGFSAADSGIVQSLREVPGLLGFGIVPLLLLFREHRLAAWSVIATGVGTALTGLFPSLLPILASTLLMSFGFHYFESLNQSLMLQYYDTRLAPLVMGRLRGLAAGGSLAISLLIFFCSGYLSFALLFLIAGGFCVLLGCGCLFFDPSDNSLPAQRRTLVWKQRYWLFYLITFLMGARRQVLTVFALFLLVEKFGYTVQTVAFLFMFTFSVNWFLNPLIGRCINIVGERRLLTLEYVLAIGIFLGYAWTDLAWLAAGLYVLDSLLVNFAFAARTFFQKIADPRDIAPSMAVAQTVNHLAAVVIPSLGGWAWVEYGYQTPFYAGAALTVISLVAAQFIDREIRKGPPPAEG